MNSPRLPLRITIVALNYAPERTGIAPYSSGLAEGLAQAGHVVRVITANPHYPDWAVLNGHPRGDSRSWVRMVRVHRLRHYIPRVPSTVRRLLAEMSFGARALLASWGRPDVVILASPALFATALVLVRARVTNTPSLVWVQDLYSLGVTETQSAGNQVALAVARLESLVLRGCSRTIVIHERFRRYVIDGLNVSRDRSAVVRNWTHLKRGSSISGATMRRKLGWGPGETIVLHAGNQGIKQGLENVVCAAKLVDQRELPIKFVLMGGGSQRQALESASAGLKSLVFLDSLPDAEYQGAMHASDVLLVNELPGLSEMAVPSKLTSYFSTGRPVLAATDSGSVTAQEVKAAGAGLQVPPADPEALVQGIQRLAADAKGSDAFGARGLDYVEGVLSEQAALQAFEDECFAVAKRGRKLATH